jgi:hypothetical protein
MVRELTIAACLMAPAPALLEAQRAPRATEAAVPARVTLAEFRQLHWIVGRWRGSGGDYPAFFEAYSVVNDSTLKRRSFSDSSFATANDSALFEWRDHKIWQVRSAGRFPVVLFTPDIVRFGPAAGRRGNSTYFRRSDDDWAAILDSGNPASRLTVYTLTRIRSAP